jgi:hypothetical protein
MRLNESVDANRDREAANTIAPAAASPAVSSGPSAMYQEVYLRTRYQTLEDNVAELQRRMLDGQIDELEFDSRRKSLLAKLKQLLREGEHLAGADGGCRQNPVSEAGLLQRGLHLMEFVRRRSEYRRKPPGGATSLPILHLAGDKNA